MATVQTNQNYVQSLQDGNLAQRIMAQPAANIGSSGVPTWAQLYGTITAHKQHIVHLLMVMNQAYQNMAASGYDVGEPTVRMNRTLEESEKTLNALNELSTRHQPKDNYMGPARTPEEAQNIVLNQTEATEWFQKFLMENTLATQAMQEFSMQLQFKHAQEQKVAEAAAAAMAAPTTGTPLIDTSNLVAAAPTVAEPLINTSVQ